jgi:hypothetical protein
MRINELLTEEQVNEISLGKKIAAGAARFAQGAGDVIGGTLGGIQGAWSRGTRAYQRGKEVVDPIANPKAEPATATTPASTDRPYVAPSTGGADDPEKLRAQAAELTQKADAIEKQKTTAPTSGGTNPAPTSGGIGIDQGLGKHGDGYFIQPGDKFDRETGKPLPGQEAPAAEPQSQALDLDQLKKDREAKQAAGQAGQQQAQQQISATQQANAAQAQQDAAIKAAADAAKAKPPFQQTAADKLAIKAAADKGIREEDEEEVAEGFRSNFLGMMI